jgi:hypothetical protein
MACTAAAIEQFAATQLSVERAVASGAHLSMSDVEAAIVASTCQNLVTWHSPLNSQPCASDCMDCNRPPLSTNDWSCCGLAHALRQHVSRRYCRPDLNTCCSSMSHASHRYMVLSRPISAASVTTGTIGL